MKQLKYSRQREHIKEILMSRCDHPTADDIYISVRKQFPNISLATVYRNLTLLESIGEIIKINSPDGGPDRFDANVEPHYHFLCNNCGIVEDIFIEPITSIIEEVSPFYSGKIESHETLFRGLCPKCLASQNLKSK